MAVTTRNTNTINAGPNSRVVVNQHVDNSRRVGVCGGHGVRGGARPVAERGGLGRGNVGACRGRGGNGRGGPRCNGHGAPRGNGRGAHRGNGRGAPRDNVRSGCGGGRGALQPQFPYIQFSNIQGSVTFHGPVTFTVCPHQHQ